VPAIPGALPQSGMSPASPQDLWVSSRGLQPCLCRHLGSGIGNLLNQLVAPKIPNSYLDRTKTIFPQNPPISFCKNNLLADLYLKVTESKFSIKQEMAW
jgi:hypothetical protein